MKNEANSSATSSFTEIIQKFPDKRILVIGDVILDQYLWGNVDRISPEAPVPIVVVTKETYRLGGAANATANICSLGGKVSMISVVGDDEDGDRLCGMLLDLDANVNGIIRSNSRSTIVKTRVIAHHQHVVRIDREKKDEINGRLADKIAACAEVTIPDVDAVLISDYDKGVISPSVLSAVIGCAKKHDKLVVIDPKMRNFWSYKGATIVTPNTNETSAAANTIISSEDQLTDAGRQILRKLDLQALLITRGEDGMTLFQTNGSPADQVNGLHIPAVAREVFDVTGAGDTVAAVITLSLAAGADFAHAARISNYAAGIVVGEVGTACISPEELLSAIEQYKGIENV